MSDQKNQLSAIMDLINKRSLPPVNDWHPSSSRDIDIRIARNGQWFYQGSHIQRESMVKLFSTVLRVDDDGDTYLVTPQEKLRITVEDAPFTAVLVERHGAPLSQTIVFTTNVGEQLVADAEHPIEVRYAVEGGEPSPYVQVRDNLCALMLRSVFYELAQWSQERDGVIGVESSGVFMPLSDPNELSSGEAARS